MYNTVTNKKFNSSFCVQTVQYQGCHLKPSRWNIITILMSPALAIH